MSRRLLCSLIAVLVIAGVNLSPAAAQSPQPVVYGVFFYLPTCSHCHEVIVNHWPGIQEEFGDSLQVLFIDASTAQGSQIMHETREALSIAASGVPLLIIGGEVMVGSIEIPMRAPEVIRAGLENGGIALPAVPVLQEVFQMAVAQQSSATDEPQAEATEIAVPGMDANPTISERLLSDPLANAVAIVILALLGVSLIVVAVAIWQNTARRDDHLIGALKRRARSVIILLCVVGIGMAFSLAVGGQNELVVLLVAACGIVIFGVTAVGGKRLARWAIPLVALLGLGVAGYLSYVELTLSDAVCGAVGNCNVVQQSAYARVFGIPVGVIGIVGYVCIAAVYIAGLLGANRQRVNQVLMGLALFGVAFSTYLTFLEPFVIGASCVWCLTSAVVMLILLWLSVLSSGDSPAATANVNMVRSTT